MNMRLSRLERKYKTFMKGSDAQSLEKVFVRKFAQIDKLYDAKEEHDHDLLFIKKNLDKMFNKYGVEKGTHKYNRYLKFDRYVNFLTYPFKALKNPKKALKIIFRR